MQKLLTKTYRNNIIATFEVRENTTDTMFAKEIWDDEYYFCNKYEIQNNWTIIDLGAHIGLFCVLAAKLGAKVYAYEPYPDNYNLLLKNISTNNVNDKITVINKAVTVNNGNFLMTEISTQDNTNTGTPAVKSWGKIPIEGISFVDIFNNIQCCNLLKLDIEGAEYDLFYSAPDYVFEKIERIVMEFHHSVEKDTREKGLELLKFLETKSYNGVVNWSYGNQGRLQAKNVQSKIR